MTNATILTESGPTLRPPLKAVLFDMDGTLVQLTPAGRMLALNETLADFGKPPITEMEQVERFWLTSARYAMIDSWGIERPQFWRAFDSEKLLQLQMENTYAFEDVGHSLNALRAGGFKLGVVSNSAHISLARKLALLNSHIARQHFETVVSCNDDVPRTKPFADGVEFALAQMGVRPEEAVLIGDSPDDLGAGQAAGVEVIIVDRGQIQWLRQMMAETGKPTDFRVITSLSDLPVELGLSLPRPRARTRKTRLPAVA